MPLADTKDRYGTVSVLLHWVVALLVFGLFALGLYMTGLGYMHPWRKLAPLTHKGFGVVLFVLVALRAVWRLANTKPDLPPMPAWERSAAVFVHGVFYPLLFIVPLSGYLISTADGRGLEVFGWFDIPATFTGFERQEDTMGVVHFYLALATVSLAGVHALAALKHHFIDRDATLLKMLGVKPKTETKSKEEPKE